MPRIVVLAQGGIVSERGPHAALLQQGGLYCAMWQAQLDAAGPVGGGGGNDDAEPLSTQQCRQCVEYACACCAKHGTHARRAPHAPTQATPTAL